MTLHSHSSVIPQTTAGAAAGRTDRRAPRRTARRGFTLLEMMLVVMIIGILATVVVVNFGGSSDKVRKQVTKSRLGQVKSELLTYNLQFGTYPPSIDIMMTLRPPSFEKLPKDGWDHLFNYAYPGSTGDSNKPYDLYSNGKDNLSGNEDDVDIWNMDAP